MSREEIIDKAFYSLDDLDYSYRKELEEMYDNVVEKAYEWLRDSELSGMGELDLKYFIEGMRE